MALKKKTSKKDKIQSPVTRPEGDTAETGTAVDGISVLRQRAEERLLRQHEELDKVTPADLQSVVHELRVHQIELEMQNEELRHSQQELEASREKYFDLYDMAPVGYVTLNEKGIILEVNLTAATLLGLERRLLIRQPLTSFIDREDEDIYYFCNKQLLEKRGHHECEVRMLKGDGTQFWARLEAIAAREDGSEPMYRTAIIDITRRKQAEDRNRERLEGVVRERTSELTVAHGEHQRMCQTRDELAVRVTQQTAELTQGNVALQTEMTERKRGEETIERLNDDLLARNENLEFANKELESFIYSVSHDLRAPLRHISGFADLMMKNVADKLDEKDKRYLSRIHDGTEKMSRLIDDLLNLSRISKQEIQRTEVNISEIAASIVAELREAHPDRSVEVEIKEGLTANADSRLIEVLLSNLLGNAWKFTAETERASIEFGTVEQKGKIIYYMRDNGAGFDQQYAGRMFWPFHRLHSEAAFEGTGIGLALVDRVIRLHGGNVWAEGIEGKGATIYFSLR